MNEKILNKNNGVTTILIEKDGKKYIRKEMDLAGVDNFKSYDLFKRSIDKLKQLQLEAIPKYINSGERDNVIFLEYEYIEGKNLKELLNSGKIFTDDEVVDILVQSIEILDVLHKNNIIHRDIKSSNIILDNRNKINFIDFNSISVEQKRGGGTTVICSFGYTAPEAIYGGSNVKSDIYSLGVVLFELLTRLKPDEIMLNMNEFDFTKIENIKLRKIVESMCDINHKTRWGIKDIKRFISSSGFIGVVEYFDKGLLNSSNKLISWKVYNRKKWDTYTSMLVLNIGGLGALNYIFNDVEWLKYGTLGYIGLLAPQLILKLYTMVRR